MVNERVARVETEEDVAAIFTPTTDDVVMVSACIFVRSAGNCDGSIVLVLVLVLVVLVVVLDARSA